MERKVALERAIALADKLRESISSQQALPPGFALSDEFVRQTERHFLGQTYEQWIERDGLVERSATSFTSIEYWLDHGRVAGALMERLALRLGQNPVLFRQMGRLHDVDYVRFPHNEANPSGDVHPVPLTQYLLDKQVPEILCVAIMEHAGYIGKGCEFSSRLSASLSACDDLATYLAAVPSTEARYTTDLSDEAQQISSEIDGPRIRLDVSRACPTRVLSKPDLYINSALKRALC